MMIVNVIDMTVVNSTAFNTLAARVRIYRTGKSGKNQGYFCCLTDCIAPQQIALESCSHPQKTQQVFESAMKKKFLVLGFISL